jgi:hypothetical protein
MPQRSRTASSPTSSKVWQSRLDQITRWSVAGVLVVLGLAAIYWKTTPLRVSDPDRYYHLEIAHRTAAEGHLRSIPEFADPSVITPFFNGYWLFTWLSSVGYKLNGETGALAVGFGFAAATFLLLLWFAHERLSIGMSVLLIFGVFLTPDAMNRFFLYRPHLYSIFFVTLILVGMFKRNRYATFGAGLLLMLGYQSPFVPVFMLLVAIAVNRHEKPWLHAGLAGLAGIAIGVVLHPYFPNNLLPLVTILKFVAPVASLVPASDLPLETAGLPPGYAVRALGFLLFPLVLLVIRCTPALRQSLFKQSFGAPSRDAVWVCICLAALWILAVRIGRALEYLVPVSVCAWAIFLSEWKQPRGRLAFLGVGVLLALPAAWGAYITDSQLRLGSPQIISLLRMLPEKAEGKKILNMEWGHGSLALYARPGYRVVDHGDPRPFSVNHSELYLLRRKLATGKIADPFGVVRFGFDADYVLAGSGPFQQQMDASPHFRLVAAVAMEAMPGFYNYLYEAAPRRLPLQVKHWELATPADRQISSLNWAPAKVVSTLPEAQRSTFLTLGTQDKCATVRPSLKQQAVLFGSTVLALGGQGDISVSINGEKYFRGELGTKGIRETEVLIPLGRKLSARDSVVMEVCAVPGSEGSGVSASFFDKALLDSLCAWKQTSAPKKQNALWKFSNSAESSCLAPYAVPAITKHTNG